MARINHVAYSKVKRSREQAALRRRRMLIPATFVMIVVLTYGCLWWHTEVTDPVTGKIRTHGQNLQKTFQVITNPGTSIETAFPGKDSIRVLLLGLDHVPSTPGDPGRIRRCDSVLIASVGLKTKQIRLVSIPRDGWVRHYQNNQNFGYDRLGHTYSYGQEYALKHGEDMNAGGVTRSKETVEQLLGFEIDYYLVIQFDGMVELVNEICPEGLVVDVEKDMKYTDNAGDLHINLKKGVQTLKGQELLGYARFRKDAMGDIGRMGRQQKVVKLLLSELIKPGNLSRLPKIVRILKDNVNTNLSLDQLIALSRQTDEFDAGSVQTMTLQSWYNLESGHERDIPGLSVDEARRSGYHVQGIFDKDVRDTVEFLNDLKPPPPPEPAEPDNAAETAESGQA